MKICDYGCGQEAKYQFKNGKWCCSKNFRSCLTYRKRNSTQIKKAHKNSNSKYNLISYKEKQSSIIKNLWLDPNSIYNSESYKQKRSITMKKIWRDPNSRLNSKSCKVKHGNTIKKLYKDPNSIYSLLKLTIEKIKNNYPTFYKEEELRYNPDKPLEEKEIQVHCKNHNCKNSKEKGGWFTPIYNQLNSRIGAIENPRGYGESNFYCSQHCKDTCILYRIRNDPFKNNNLPYTYQEYQACRAVVFDRENNLCEYCGEPATDMHHIFPVKKEPFFALDPDYCVACCEKHHYEYAHKEECSTGNLAKIVCSVESQKFLNQTLEDIS